MKFFCDKVLNTPLNYKAKKMDSIFTGYPDLPKYFVWKSTSPLLGSVGHDKVAIILAIIHLEIIPTLDTGRKLNVHKTFRRRPMYIQFRSSAKGVI